MIPAKKTSVFKERKELIEKGNEGDKLKIRNFTLYNDELEVPLNDTPNNQTKTWLYHLQILQFNARSLVDCQRWILDCSEKLFMLWEHCNGCWV